MDIKVEKLQSNTVKLEITVPVSEFKKGIEKSYRKNVQKFNVPGFRKGKTPKAIIEKMYGEEVLYDDAVNYVIDETYPKAVDDSKIEPVDRPEIDIVEIGRDKDLVYTATVTVKPEVELSEYKGVEVSKVEFPVSEEDVEKQLEAMRQKNARMINKEDGTVEKGDIAVIDYEGFMDGVPFEGGKGSNHQLEIGSGSFIEGFEEQLIGKKAGEDIEVTVTFPEEYRATDLAGKPALFKVKINEVKFKELLPLDDEFAKDVSEFENLEELKADIRGKIQESNDTRAKREFENSIIKKVIDNAKVDIPEVMVTKEVDYMIQDLSYRLRYQGVSFEQYVELVGTTVDKVKEDYKEPAQEKVKTALVIEKIGKVENIEATDEEVQAEIEKMAKQYNQEADKFASSIGDRERNIIKEDVIANKTIEFLVQNAVTTA